MLIYDIVLDEEAFKTASKDIRSLVTRTSTLRSELEDLYKQLKGALDTPAGRQVEFTATNVLLQPLNDLLAVLNHVSDTLNQIIGTGYYKDVFVKFEELNEGIN